MRERQSERETEGERERISDVFSNDVMYDGIGSNQDRTLA